MVKGFGALFLIGKLTLQHNSREKKKDGKRSRPTKQKFLFHKVPPFLITAHNQADFLMQKYPGSIRGI